MISNNISIPQKNIVDPLIIYYSYINHHKIQFKKKKKSHLPKKPKALLLLVKRVAKKATYRIFQEKIRLITSLAI